METKAAVEVDRGAFLWPTLTEPGFRNAWRLCLHMWLKDSHCASDCISKLAELLQRDVCWRFVFLHCFGEEALRTTDSLLRPNPAFQRDWSHKDWLQEVRARELLYKIQAAISTQPRIAWLGSHSTLDMERIARGEFIFGAPFGPWSSGQRVGYEWTQEKHWSRLAKLRPNLLVCDLGSTSHISEQHLTKQADRTIVKNLCQFLHSSQAPFCFLLELNSVVDCSSGSSSPVMFRGLEALNTILEQDFTTYTIRLHEKGGIDLQDDWVLVAERKPAAGPRKSPPGWAQARFVYERKDFDRRADLLAAWVKAEVFRGPAGPSL